MKVNRDILSQKFCELNSELEMERIDSDQNEHKGFTEKQRAYWIKKEYKRQNHALRSIVMGE